MASSSSSPSPSSPLLALDADALFAVLRFVERRQIGAMTRTSKQTAAATLAVRCLQLELSVDMRSEADAFALCASPLARVHLSSMLLRFDPAAIGTAFLDEMADRLVALRFLFLGPTTLPMRQWRLPVGLTGFTLGGSCSDAHIFAPLIAAIAQLRQLEGMQLMLNEASQVDLSPLVALPSLSSLWLHFNRPPAVEMADTLRRMPALRTLRMPFYGLMQQLTREPHQLRLQECEGVSAWTEEIATAMSRVPTLTTIDLGAFMGPSLSFLAAFPQLSTLSITILPRYTIAKQPQDIADSLCKCTQLTSLRIQCSPLNCAQWASILRSLPVLVSLEMTGCREVESLLCFADPLPSLSRSLTSLSVCGLNHPFLGPADVAYLLSFFRSLTSLRNLCLAGARPGLFDLAFIAQIRCLPWFHRLLSFQPPPIKIERHEAGEEDEQREDEQRGEEEGW